MRSKNKFAPETIGFRLEPEASEVLQERASQLGVSPHALARRYVIQLLEEAEDRANTTAHLMALHEQVNLLREEVATTIEVLLVTVGKVDSHTAHKYIEENFSR